MNPKYTPEQLKLLRQTRDMSPYRALLKDIALYTNIFKDLTIVEIGVRRGISTKAMLQGLAERIDRGIGTGHLWSIDKDLRDPRVMAGPDKTLWENWTFLNVYSNPASHERSNREECAPAVEWDGRSVDVLWIDGDHSLQGVKDDWEYWEPFVSPGGLIVMHDVMHPHFGVKDFWKEITYPKSILPLNNSGFGVVNKPL